MLIKEDINLARYILEAADEAEMPYAKKMISNGSSFDDIIATLKALAIETLSNTFIEAHARLTWMETLANAITDIVFIRKVAEQLDKEGFSCTNPKPIAYLGKQLTLEEADAFKHLVQHYINNPVIFEALTYSMKSYYLRVGWERFY